MIEIWKDVIGYEGLYQVSSLGRVKSLRFGKEKILSPVVNGYGYLIVSLHKDGKLVVPFIHRLVAQAFLSNPLNLPEVNHKDEDKTNNSVDNLEWCTRQYNAEYSKAKPVAQYDLSGNLIKIWNSVAEIERLTGFTHRNISNCCRGEQKTAYNFIWKYI